MTQAPAGWYPVQDGSGERYWDGSAWTEQRRPIAQEPQPMPAATQQPVAPEAVVAPSAGSSNRLTVPQRVSAVAIWVTILAVFLPWVSFFGISKLGIEGDGVLTLVLGIAGAVLLTLTSGFMGKPRAVYKVVQVILLVLAAPVALVGLLDMNGVAAMGLYLTLFAGVAWVVGAAWQLSLSRPTSS